MQRESLTLWLRRALTVLGTVALASSCVSDESEPSPGEEEISPAPPPEMIAALRRDLGLTDAQIHRRLAVEARAARVEPDLRAALGDRFGGAWIDDDGERLVVGITDPSLADGVRDAGAEPRLVTWSLAQLDAVKATLDREVAHADAGIHAWHVDVARNRVVVHAADPDSPSVDELVGALGVAGAIVEVVASPERPRPFYTTRGGDEYIINSNTLCSIGFAVVGGFVTAGHCGGAGSPTAGSNWVAQGTFMGSTFPGHDYAWVKVNSNWDVLASVNNYAGGAVAVAGSNVASVNSSICRSGRTSGWRCGTIQAKDVTINYAAGPVYGATQTSACAEGGDSGGSFISGNQAQGVTSGGSGNCSTGGTTFFQPVKPILSAYGLTLKTSGSSTKEIVSNFNSKCIDVPWSSFVDGAKLQMWTCNGSAAQRWTFVDGTIRAGGLCMDVAWGSTADGAAIQLANCSGNLAQKFTFTSAGDLVSVLANKCVDIKDWNSADGARLQTWTCGGTANQKWHLQ